MVTRFLVTYFTIIFIFTLCIAADRSNDLVPYAEFIAGCSLLRTAPVARYQGGRAACFRRLKKITGLPTNEVLAFLEGIRNDPKKGKEMYDIMQQTFSSSLDSIK
ncbi:MAG: hypothetical protein JW913_06800 [Chitinispirillaceae bacterium]|nr:hypothetical protein [Chitinispirillaceae bacterium]